MSISSISNVGFRHGMTPAHLKEFKRLEKENKTLKELLAEKEVEGRLKDRALKKKCTWVMHSRLKNGNYIK